MARELARLADALRRVDRAFRVRPEAFAAFGSLACAVSASVVAGAILTGGCGPRGTGLGASSLPATPDNKPTSSVGTAVASAPGPEGHKPAGGRSVHVTLYHLAAQQCPDPAQVALPRCGGGSITTVSNAFLKSVRMQGSAKLCDGRVVGVQKLSPLCFVVVGDGFPWGMTASGRPATPFRSIAVDPKVFALGHWYYVQELDGLSLPGPAAGKRHDGCVHADDVGGAVKGDLVDWFVGPHDAVKALGETVTKLNASSFHVVEADGYCAKVAPL